MIIDTKTKNKSFIKVYRELKDKGIKNNKFFLILYDEKLQGVDPLQEETLSEEMKMRVRVEIQRNPWYFFREVCRIPVSGGKKKFELNRGILAMLFAMLNSLNSFTMLPRQHGKTTSSICCFIWIYYYATSYSNILFINKTLGDSKRNLKTFKDIAELLPSYLKAVDPKLDKDNEYVIYNASNGNSISTVSNGINDAEADKKGRGCTTPLQLWDEFAWIKYNSTMYKAAAPATSQAKLEAKNNGKIYGTTIITTPNNIDLDEGRYCKVDFIDKMCKFDETMYDWTLSEILECIDKKSDNNFIYIEFSYSDLGRDEEWFRQQCKDLNQDLLKIKREILLEWTKSSEVSVYTEEQLEQLESLIRPTVAKLNLRKYYFVELYDEDIDFTKSYIISGDIATGMEQDASTLAIIDPYSLMCVGEFRENKIDTEDYKWLIFELITKFFINSVVVLENNAVGKSIIDWLMKSPISKHIYYEYQDRVASKLEEDKKVITHRKVKKKMQVGGVVTTKASRPLMLELLDSTMREEPELVATKNLYADIKGLERDKKGKIQHSTTSHDDSLFGYLIGRYCLAYGTNLAKFMIPINGKDPKERKKSMSIMTHELELANKLDIYGNNRGYTGLANSIIDNEKKIINEKNNNRKSKSIMRFYNKISQI